MRLNFVVCVLLLCVCNSFSRHIFFNVDEDVFFKFYKRDNPTNFIILKQNSSQLFPLESFDPKIPTRICIHGYLAKVKTLDRFREAFLNAGDFNYIMVDWSKGAFNLNYYKSKARIIPIADKLANLINALVERGMNVKDLSLVGHSLGAHLGGIAAKKLNMTDKIGSIIGLDPASVGFSIKDKENRLDKDDADYVQVIHTDVRFYGIAEPIGHADIYSHGGKKQPGCASYKNISTLSTIDKCSHARSYELFFETLKSDFLAIQCASYEEISKNECTFKNVTMKMGGNILSDSDKRQGIFYIETKPRSPFAISDYNMFKNIIINPPIQKSYQTSEILKSKPKMNKRLMDIFTIVEDKVTTFRAKVKDNQKDIEMQDITQVSLPEVEDLSSRREMKMETEDIKLDGNDEEKSMSYKGFINWIKDVNSNLNATNIKMDPMKMDIFGNHFL